MEERMTSIEQIEKSIKQINLVEKSLEPPKKRSYPERFFPYTLEEREEMEESKVFRDITENLRRKEPKKDKKQKIVMLPKMKEDKDVTTGKMIDIPFNPTIVNPFVDSKIPEKDEAEKNDEMIKKQNTELHEKMKRMYSNIENRFPGSMKDSGMIYVTPFRIFGGPSGEPLENFLELPDFPDKPIDKNIPLPEQRRKVIDYTKMQNQHVCNVDLDLLIEYFMKTGKNYNTIMCLSYHLFRHPLGDYDGTDKSDIVLEALEYELKYSRDDVGDEIDERLKNLYKVEKSNENTQVLEFLDIFSINDGAVKRHATIEEETLLKGESRIGWPYFKHDPATVDFKKIERRDIIFNDFFATILSLLPKRDKKEIIWSNVGLDDRKINTLLESKAREILLHLVYPDDQVSPQLTSFYLKWMNLSIRYYVEREKRTEIKIKRLIIQKQKAYINKFKDVDVDRLISDIDILTTEYFNQKIMVLNEKIGLDESNDSFCQYGISTNQQNAQITASRNITSIRYKFYRNTENVIINEETAKLLALHHERFELRSQARKAILYTLNSSVLDFIFSIQRHFENDVVSVLTTSVFEKILQYPFTHIGKISNLENRTKWLQGALELVAADEGWMEIFPNENWNDANTFMELYQVDMSKTVALNMIMRVFFDSMIQIMTHLKIGKGAGFLSSLLFHDIPNDHELISDGSLDFDTTITNFTKLVDERKMVIKSKGNEWEEYHFILSITHFTKIMEIWNSFFWKWTIAISASIERKLFKTIEIIEKHKSENGISLTSIVSSMNPIEKRIDLYLKDLVASTASTEQKMMSRARSLSEKNIHHIYKEGKHWGGVVVPTHYRDNEKWAFDNHNHFILKKYMVVSSNKMHSLPNVHPITHVSTLTLLLISSMLTTCDSLLIYYKNLSSQLFPSDDTPLDHQIGVDPQSGKVKKWRGHDLHYTHKLGDIITLLSNISKHLLIWKEKEKSAIIPREGPPPTLFKPISTFYTPFTNRLVYLLSLARCFPSPVDLDHALSKNTKLDDFKKIKK